MTTKTVTKWLLVEDEPDLFDMLMYVWSAVDMKAIAYTNGEDALSWLETISLKESLDSPALPKFALIDIRLPGKVSGIDVATQLSQHAILGNMPVFLMTAYRINAKAEGEILQQCKARKIIYKPLPHVNELRNMLMNVS